MVNYYQDVWQPYSHHLLVLLTSMTSAKLKWQWTTEHQESFNQTKDLMAKETQVTFRDFTKEFETHTDASKLQLGANIT